LDWWSGIAADLATALGFCAVLIGLFLGWRQFRAAQAGQRKIHAQTQFLDFLKFGLQYPHLATGPQFQSNGEVTPAYLFFVRVMLNSFEYILESCPEPEWEDAMALHLRVHRGYLESDSFWRLEIISYDARMRDLIARKLVPEPVLVPTVSIQQTQDQLVAASPTHVDQS
jgi:hypothetical protein